MRKGLRCGYRLIPDPLGFVEVQPQVRFEQRQIDHERLKILPAWASRIENPLALLCRRGNKRQVFVR